MDRRLEMHGIVVPIITPLLPSGEVDTRGIRSHVDFLLDGGVHGIWVLGATGQFDTLSDSQRDAALEAVVEQVRGRVLVLAGCIDTGPGRSIERARRAEQIGADAVFAVTPGFAPVAQTEVLTHFRRLKEATSLPLVAYNAQYATQTPLPLATVRTLAEEGSLSGLKDSADFGDFRQLVVGLADLPEFPVMTGIQFLADAALLMGARGCIPPLANIVPRWFVDVYENAVKGDWAQAARIQNRIATFNSVVREWAPGASVFGAFLGASKTALRLLGVLDHAVPGDPYPTPTPAQVEAMRIHLQRFGLLEDGQTGPGRISIEEALGA